MPVVKMALNKKKKVWNEIKYVENTALSQLAAKLI